MDSSDVLGQDPFLDPILYQPQSEHDPCDDLYIDPFLHQNNIDMFSMDFLQNVELECTTAQPPQARKRRRQSTPKSDRQGVSPQSQHSQQVLDSNDPAAIRRVRNTKAARKSRQKKTQMMNELQTSLAAERASLAAERAKVKELEAKVAQYEELGTAESAQRPTSIAILDDIDNGPFNNEDDLTECPINLTQDDFECLKPGAPLNDRIVNAGLCLLSALAPYTIQTADSSADKVGFAACDWLKGSGQGSSHPRIFIPIHIPPRTTSIDHWALVVLDANDARLLDSHPTEFHTQFAKERVQALFNDQPSFQPTWTFAEETGCARLDPESVDCGVLVLVDAIYTAAASLGSTIGPPSTIDAELWRDVLGLVLRMAMGQAWSLPWAERLGRESIPEGEQVELSREKAQLVEQLSSSFTSLQNAYSDITDTEQLLSRHKARLAKVATEVDRKRKMTAREGNDIRMILESLCGGAVSQEWQAEKLDAEKKHYEGGLSALAWLDQSSAEFLFTYRGHQISKISQLDVRKRLRKLDTCLARRVAMLASLGKTVRELGEVVKALEENLD